MEREKISIGPLVQALGDPDEAVRKAAIAALQNLKDAGPEPLLAGLTALGSFAQKGADKSARVSAIELLGDLGRRAEPIVPDLEFLRSDRDPDLSRTATRSLVAILTDLFNAHREASDWGKAAADARKLIEIEPQKAQHFADLGFIEEQRKNWAASESAYTRAVELNSQFAAAWARRAAVRQRRSRWEEAVADYTRAVDISDEGSFRRGRANALADLGRWKRALTDASKAVELSSSDARALANRAEIRLRAGDLRGYRDDCRAILARFGESDDPRTINGVAWICVLGDGAVTDPGAVVRMAEQNVARERSHEYLQTLGAAYYRAGRWADAVRILREAVALDKAGGNVFDHLFLAMALDRDGSVEASRSSMVRAVSLAAKDRGARREPAMSQVEIVRREANDLLAESIFAHPFTR